MVGSLIDEPIAGTGREIYRSRVRHGLPWMHVRLKWLRARAICGMFRVEPSLTTHAASSCTNRPGGRRALCLRQRGPPPSPPSCCPGSGLGWTRPGSGCFAVLHRDSIPDAVRVVRERSVDAVLVSVHRCGPEQMEAVGHLVREFPGIPTVALLSQHDPGSTEMLLRLGASGVRQVVDVTSPTRLESAAAGGGAAGHPGGGADPGADPRGARPRPRRTPGSSSRR